MNEIYYMGESLFVPVVALTLLTAYRYWRSPTAPNALFLGLAGGAAWLVRGESLLVLGFILLGTLVFMSYVPFLRRLLYGLLAGGVCVAMMMPWVVYNLSRFDEPVYIAQRGTALALNSCDETWYGPATGWYSFECLRVYSENSKAEHGKVTDRGLREQGVAYISAHLDRLPIVMAVRVGREFGVYEIDDTFVRNVRYEGRREDFVIQLEAMYRIMIPFAILGLVSMRRRRVPISPIFGAALAVAVGVASTYAIWRYRLAFDVALVASAAVGLTWLADLLWRLIGKLRQAGAHRWPVPRLQDPDTMGVAKRSPLMQYREFGTTPIVFQSPSKEIVMMVRFARSSRGSAMLFVALTFVGVGVAACSTTNPATSDASNTSVTNSAAPTSNRAGSTIGPGSSSSAPDATRSTTTITTTTTVAPLPTTPDGYAQVLVAAWRSGDRALAASVADGATVNKLFAFTENPNDFAFLDCGGAAGSTICRFGGGSQELMVSVRNTTGGLAMQVTDVRMSAP